MKCNNEKCWAHSKYHSAGCIFNLMHGCETNGIKCKDPIGFEQSNIQHSLTDDEADIIARLV